MRTHVAADERKHRVRLGERPRDGEIDRLRVERRGEPRDEIERQERRIARTRDDVRRGRGGDPRVQSGQRSGEVGNDVGDDRIAERRIAIAILVRVDDERIHLRRESLDDVRDQRTAAERDESLVDAAHPSSLAAGEHDAGDVGALDHRALASSNHQVAATRPASSGAEAASTRNRCAPVNSR